MSPHFSILEGLPCVVCGQDTGDDSVSMCRPCEIRSRRQDSEMIQSFKPEIVVSGDTLIVSGDMDFLQFRVKNFLLLSKTDTEVVFRATSKECFLRVIFEDTYLVNDWYQF
jgi:hypothetical protein